MGADDKMRNAMNDVKGKAKETVGKITDNESLEAEGHADQAKASVGKTTENVKDVIKGD